MMMVDSTTFQEEQIQNRIMGRLENEFCLTCLLRGQSTFGEEMCSRANLGKLAGDNIDLPENPFFGC